MGLRFIIGYEQGQEDEPGQEQAVALLLHIGMAPAAIPLVWAKPEPLIPYGAVIATANLVDCAPIGGPTDFRTGLWEGDGGDCPGRHVIVCHDPWGPDDPVLVLDTPEGRSVDVSDQLPFGDFTPGRFGWILTDITPVAPVAVNGRQGLWEWEGQ